MKKLNSSCGQNQKLKLWPNSKTQMVTKVKNSNRDKTLKKKLLWQKGKTQIKKKSNCDITKKNSNFDITKKTQNVTVVIVKKQLDTSLKLCQNSKTWIATKLKNSNCDKT